MAKTVNQPENPNKAGILIKCHGGYYYKTDTARGVKPFKIDVKAPSIEFFREESSKYTGTDDNGVKQFKTRSYINIRGQLKKRMLPILLPRVHVDFARVRFVVIDEVVSLDASPLDLPISFLSRAQLAEVIKKEQMPINVAEYLEIDELRSDIQEYRNDPETFLQQKPGKDQKRDEERQFMEMNQLDMSLPPMPKPKTEGLPTSPEPAGPGIFDN